MENLTNGDSVHLNGEGQVSVEGQQIYKNTMAEKIANKAGMDIDMGGTSNITEKSSNNLIFFVNGKY